MRRVMRVNTSSRVQSDTRVLVPLGLSGVKLGDERYGTLGCWYRGSGDDDVGDTCLSSSGK
jgi:hypothetical protein